MTFQARLPRRELMMTAGVAGIVDRTILCFGHVTDEPHRDGSVLRGEWLTERAEAIRDRYDAMPGVASYQSDSPELRSLVRHCDTLPGRLWP